MIAYKCDRCGKYYEEYKKDIYDLPEKFVDERFKRKDDYVDGIIICSNKNGQCDGMSKHIDLCPECMEELIAFLDGKYKHAIAINCAGNSIEGCVRRLKNDRKSDDNSGKDDLQEHRRSDKGNLYAEKRYS